MKHNLNRRKYFTGSKKLKNVKMFEEFNSDEGILEVKAGETIDLEDLRSEYESTGMQKKMSLEEFLKKVKNFTDKGIKDIKKKYPDFLDESEEFLNEKEKYNAFYLLSSSSKVNTANPEENGFISEWDKMSYFLVKTRLNPNGIIVAGSHSSNDYGLKVGDTMHMFDDGNKTTRFPASYERSYDRGQKRMVTKRRHPLSGLTGTVVAIATSAEEITKNFPKGTYSLVVMK